ncbi:MAG: class I SAM-dependent methyltransferase [Chitinophagaceae bacterium]
MIGIELGCAEGFLAYEFMKAGLEKLYMVDNWNEIKGQKGDGGFPQIWHEKNYFKANERMKHYGNNVIFLKGLTDKMAKHIPDNSVGLVYVDADHSYDGVLKDINSYWPKLVSGGIMAFHDFIAPQYGVKQAVYHFMEISQISEITVIPENKEEDSGAYIIKLLKQ